MFGLREDPGCKDLTRVAPVPVQGPANPGNLAACFRFNSSNSSIGVRRITVPTSDSENQPGIFFALLSDIDRATGTPPPSPPPPPPPSVRSSAFAMASLPSGFSG